MVFTYHKLVSAAGWPLEARFGSEWPRSIIYSFVTVVAHAAYSVILVEHLLFSSPNTCGRTEAGHDSSCGYVHLCLFRASAKTSLSLGFELAGVHHLPVNILPP